MRKSTFYICENKDADHHKGDQRLCFRYTDNTIPLLPKSEISNSSHLQCLCSPVSVGRNPEDRFSHNEAHLEYLAGK